ncbi:MAG: hypothetical protein WCW52_02140 [Elusimicrobiales bacterium]|jgi:hypothetical protein
MSGASRALFLAPLLSLSACAVPKPDIIQVGPWFPARPAGEVRIFSSKSETDRPWGAIAIIHSERLPAEDKAGLERQKKMARKLAAGIGADGLIIGQETVSDPGSPGVYQAPETFISALAFKYATEISTGAK